MNHELFQEKWNQYKEEFFKESPIYNEKYKWNVLKQVSDKWDWTIDDKSTMFNRAFEVKGSNNLWTSINYYPITMANWFFNDFPNETLAAFESLFNENVELLTRLNDFKKYFDNQLKLLQTKYPDKKLNYHSQDIRSMSLYLFLQNPSKYSLFKYSFVKNFSEQLGMGFIRKGQNDNYIIYLDILNQVKKIISSDPFIQKYLQYNNENSLYRDESLHLLIQDFMYCSVTYNNHTSGKKYWLYSPGESAYKWDEFYDLGIMALGWDDLQDLNTYSDRDELNRALYDIYGGNENKSNDTTANDEFINSINIGDTIIVKRGRKKLIGTGEVISDYYYDEDREEYKHSRKVNWKRKGEWDIDQHMAVKTLTDITNYDSGLDDGKKYYEYLLSMMDNNSKKHKNEHIINLLEYKGQIILQGPPGTGKTREAKLLAKEMLKLNSTNDLQNNKQFKLIQFHPSYTYEDFVRGIVAESKGNKIEYKNVNKTLGEFADLALKNYKASKETGIDNNLDFWIDTQFESFKEDIKAQLPENEIPLSGDITIYDVVDNSFKYGKNWKTASHILFGEFKNLIRAILKKELELSNKQMDKERFKHAHYRYTYYNALLERFFQEYKYEFSGELIKEKKYILVIDEINRANLSSVLGELIYALEYRNESVHSPYGIKDENNNVKTELILPPNLYIIGTMNTA